MLNQILDPLLRLFKIMALVLMLAAVIYIAHLRAERAELELNLSAARLTVKSLERELAADQAALARRENQRAELAAEKEALIHELSELYLNNEPCAVWAESHMPGDVYDRLRRAVP